MIELCVGDKFVMVRVRTATATATTCHGTDTNLVVMVW